MSQSPSTHKGTCDSRDTCPFCRAIEDGDIFFRSHHFAAITNIAPIVPGHTLLVPRRHVLRLTDLSGRELTELGPASHHVSELLKAAFGATGINWSIQDGADAGQTVFHLHLHILPRCHKDMRAPGDWYPHVETWQERFLDSTQRPTLDDEARSAITAHLRNLAARRPFEN